MAAITQLCLLVAVLPTVLTITCTNKPNGIYEHGCRAWTTCINGIANTTECKEEHVFDSQTQECRDPSQVPPPCGMLKDCTNLKDGKYADTGQKCQTYYTCSGGTFFGHNFCPKGTVFNEVLQSCDWPQDTPPPCGTLHITTP
ncbi:U-scoloptoxin(01)-Cw1a-like [Gigantopelta aegis]|uniref:U-scoloptoxin(01)-Cw1a-like n=1 Tax=Gigantopelta aegis TaxID=1735272 RepID=UPI001B889AC0|nr:U-scoloptoxin(01)-Cw1a-like [Gigantopelta aegis]